MTSGAVSVIALAVVAVTTCAARACPNGTCPTKAAGSQVNTVRSSAPPAQPIPALDFSAASDPLPAPSPSPVSATRFDAYLQRGAFDCADFQRNGDGSWRAVRAVVFPAPDGRLTVDVGSLYRPGQFVEGYALGSMLEHDCLLK